MVTFTVIAIAIWSVYSLALAFYFLCLNVHFKKSQNGVHL